MTRTASSPWRRSAIPLLCLGAAHMLAPLAHAQDAAPSAPAAAAPAEAAPSSPAPERVSDEVRATLTKFGSFVAHPTYGEVWVPTVTPQGWHPYPPCHWVKAKGWGLYFDDQTPWGQIVHHYGRWARDAQMGWIWVPGTAFSPAWVTWRASPQWMGWAPMPPEQDMQKISADDMNNGDHWIFQETAKLIKGCDARDPAPPAQIPALIQATPYLRNFGMYGGVAVPIAPAYVGDGFVDINLAVAPWPNWFLTQVIVHWNWIWHHTTIHVVINKCVPKN